MSHCMEPIHPGEHLAELGISQYRLAKEIHVPPRRINEIVHGKRAITADTALRLGRFFGMEPGFWMNLQTRYDMERAATMDILDKDMFIAINTMDEFIGVGS